MILLRSLRLETFKGIERLTCEFEDLTVLAGLNNSGKTSVLQAIYLLVSTLPPLGEHPHLVSTNEKQRTVDLTSPLATLGLPSFDWLLQGPETPFLIVGTFWNGCTVQIRMVGHGRFCFSVTGENDSLEQDAAQRMLRELNELSAELFRPPGVLSSRERMFATGDQYRQQVASGQGNQYWRNSIWWGTQAAGQESFRPVQEMVERHFLQVAVQLPVLATKGDPYILIKYKEGKRSPLDIAQAGAGLHTFIALAQLIEQSKANFLLLDEPDVHLHASQQALVLDLLTEVALGEERQVFIATHSSELLARVTRDSIRWLDPGSERAEGGVDIADLLDRLGVAPNIYISKSDFPDIIVYVEGKQDKPLMDALIAWCRDQHKGLPTTLVVRHNAGRFSAVALQAISRIALEAQIKTRVVGIRDLDWDYCDCDTLPPPEEAEKHEGDGHVLERV